MDTSKLNDLRSRFLKAQQSAAVARSRVERAQADADAAAEELGALGFDVSQPLEPQLERVYEETVAILDKTEKILAEADRILTGPSGS